MAQVLTVGIQPLNYDHKFSLRATAWGGGVRGVRILLGRVELLS